MRRVVLTSAAAFAAGAVASALALVSAQTWARSPTRLVEEAMEFDLPQGTQLLWEREEFEAFFGEGSRLMAFKVPGAAFREIISDCPSRFSHGTFEAAGLPLLTDDGGPDLGEPSCYRAVVSQEATSIVVFSGDRLYFKIVDN